MFRNYESPFPDDESYPRRSLELPAAIDLEDEDLYAYSPFSSKEQEKYNDYEEEDSVGYVDTESVVSASEHASLELLDTEDTDDVFEELIELDNELWDELAEGSEDQSSENFEEDFAISLDKDISDDEFENDDLESYLGDESVGEEWEEVDEIENNESKGVRYEDEHNHQTYDLDETEGQNSYDDEADEYGFESDSTSPVHIESQIKRRHKPQRPDRLRGSAFEIESDNEYDFDVNEITIAGTEDDVEHDAPGEEIDEEIANELFAYDVEKEGYPGSYYGEVDLDSEGELHESLFIEPIEDEDVFDEDLEWLSEEVKLVESYIPSSKLSWSDASREQLQFMQKVYKAVVARSSKKRSFIPSFPNGELSEIENIKLQKDAASALEKLLQAARQKINGLEKNVKIKIASGYRSADKQFRLWEKKFPDYYKRTQIARSKLSGGDHGNRSVNYMAGFIGRRLAAPGYSLHQSGVAVDFQPTENGKRFIISTKSAHRKNWRNTWFWNWLTNNAATYKFYQNNNIDEPWHWEYRGNNGAKPKLPVRNVGTDDISARGSIIEKAKDAAASGKSLYIAMSLISKGERDENKITNIVFYSKYPNKKGIKLKRNDPLVKDWLDIRKNIVRPLLEGVSDTQNSKVNDSRSDHILPEGKLSYVKYSNGDLKRFTPEAVLWLAKMIDAETWGKPTEDDARSMLWALVQRTAIWKFRKWSWVKMIQAYSQPINPRWTSSGDKCSRYYKSSFSGTIPERCSVRRVNRRTENIQKKWIDVHPIARRVVLEFIAGKIPNHIPGAVGWFAPGTWKSRERNGANRKSNMVHRATIDGNVYFAMNKRPDTTNWTVNELVIKNA